MIILVFLMFFKLRCKNGLKLTSLNLTISTLNFGRILRGSPLILRKEGDYYAAVGNDTDRSAAELGNHLHSYQHEQEKPIKSRNETG